jgi:ATP-binding cassette subfamily B protein RaxB
LITTVTELESLRVHVERVRDVAGYDVDVIEPSVSRSNGRGADPERARVPRANQISVVDLSFRFAPTDPVVIKDLNLEIAAGEFVAIHGPSGCGKTTLLKLLLRLYEPTAGRVLVDGEDLSGEALSRWRRQVGVVSQDDRLLAGTISQNISFFDGAENHSQVRRAAALAGIDDEIISRPMGYNSLVGYGGGTLSGGQRQRVLLARALYNEPKMLVLDEGTANLDPEAERRICDVVASLDMTRIVVAHRPELVRRADRVITLVPQRLQPNGESAIARSSS